MYITDLARQKAYFFVWFCFWGRICYSLKKKVLQSALKLKSIRQNICEQHDTFIQNCTFDLEDKSFEFINISFKLSYDKQFLTL